MVSGTLGALRLELGFFSKNRCGSDAFDVTSGGSKTSVVGIDQVLLPGHSGMDDLASDTLGGFDASGATRVEHASDRAHRGRSLESKGNQQCMKSMVLHF